MKNYKPVVFIQGDRKFYRENKYAQNIILKALSEGVTDVNDLKKMAGMRTAAEVFRTLDKLAIRKEYHAALANNGITLDYIAGGIKQVADTSMKESVRLKAYQTLLRSLGLEKYDNEEETGKNWEETIIAAFEKGDKLVGDDKTTLALEEDYEVEVPAIPESVAKKRAEENALARELYGN